MSIHEVLVEYLQRNLDGKASQSKGRIILAYLSEFFDMFDVRFVSEITLDLQDRYIAWRRESLLCAGYTASNGTIQRELVFLKAAMRAYWKRGYLASTPYVRSLPQPPGRQRFLTQEEFESLLAECHEPHLRLFVLIAAHTLQRPGAILGLRIEQVDLSRGVIDFLPLGSMQTRKRRPVVPITSTLMPLLRNAIDRSQSGFVVEYNGTRLKAIRTSFTKARKRAGLGSDVTPYVLRHTGATLLAAAGIPLRQVAGMLGHSELRTTEMYAKHSPRFLRDAAEMLDDLFGASKAGLAPLSLPHREVGPNEMGSV
ncbi:MAG: site-specific integrase [Phycisphaerales bacterium]|nr:site-specific integrase [Phycisphaerales bacterium]